MENLKIHASPQDIAADPLPGLNSPTIRFRKKQKVHASAPPINIFNEEIQSRIFISLIRIDYHFKYYIFTFMIFFCFGIRN